MSPFAIPLLVKVGISLAGAVGLYGLDYGRRRCNHARDNGGAEPVRQARPKGASWHNFLGAVCSTAILLVLILLITMWIVC
jgi:hypothetical protein